VKRVSIAILACMGMLLVSAPAAVAEKPGSSNGEAQRIAAKACNAEKKADKAAFEARWGKHAMRECKRALGGELADEAKNAAQECRAEREADPAGFVELYGTNENGKNAFGKCVSEKVHEDEGEEPPSS
jgi:hypothetical protein